ncbi:hypothetical protein HDU96_008407 [Phlyctochytrium bullatum]|nr:hypothetical protein HDU96_008407 [Phlyctochytrium bullatum]
MVVAIPTEAPAKPPSPAAPAVTAPPASPVVQGPGFADAFPSAMSHALSGRPTGSAAVFVPSASRTSSKSFQPTIEAAPVDPDNSNTGAGGASTFRFPPFAIAAVVVGVVLAGLGVVGLWWLHRRAARGGGSLSRSGSLKAGLAEGGLGRVGSQRSVPAGPGVMGLVEAAVARRYGPVVHEAMYQPSGSNNRI